MPHRDQRTAQTSRSIGSWAVDRLEDAFSSDSNAQETIQDVTEEAGSLGDPIVGDLEEAQEGAEAALDCLIDPAGCAGTIAGEATSHILDASDQMMTFIARIAGNSLGTVEGYFDALVELAETAFEDIALILLAVGMIGVGLVTSLANKDTGSGAFIRGVL